MKELQLKKPDTELQAEDKQELKFIGSMLLKRGMNIYEFNLETMEIKEAFIKRTNSMHLFKQKATENGKVSVSQHCIYYQAINLKNAVKKANKIVFQRSGIKDYFMCEKGKVLRKVIDEKTGSNPET